MTRESWATTPAVRKSMRANRSRDTRPELALRRALHAMGLRFRVCARPLPKVRRTADVVFRPSRVAVEVRGCFWHGCPQHYRAPSANGGYWSDKVARNLARDAATEQTFDEAGWQLIAIWEHEDVAEAARRIYTAVRERRPPRSRPSSDDATSPR
ncbi:MAG: very short patch repair endonuclease [Micromonosporaceae bacterium]